MSTARDSALAIWWEQLGRPYRWGGDDPGAGFDCSGLVIEGLKAVGLLPRKGDWRARDLLVRFGAGRRRLSREEMTPGALVFWKRGSGIGHVEIVWQVLDDGTVLTLGASGGGRKTLTMQDAIKQNAFIKVRPLVEPYAAAIDPFD